MMLDGDARHHRPCALEQIGRREHFGIRLVIASGREHAPVWQQQRNRVIAPIASGAREHGKGVLSGIPALSCVHGRSLVVEPRTAAAARHEHSAVGKYRCVDLAARGVHDPRRLPRRDREREVDLLC